MMNKSYKCFWFATCFIFIFLLPAYNQFETSPVEKSDQKIRYQGKTYYIHTVKQGNTLYSICKAYAVTQDDISLANPDAILSPLSVGLVLKIPVHEVLSPSATEANATPDQSDNNFIFHTVQSKENPFFLHQKYNVPLEEIYRYNPGSEDGIQIGQVIKIPKKHLYDKIDFQPEISQEGVKRYTVKQGDTLYRIAQIYNITIGDILNANEELRWGLKAGQVINIPVITEIIGTSITLPDTVFMVSSRSRLSYYQCDSIATLKRMRPPVKVALLLPFYASENFDLDISTSSDILSETDREKPKAYKGRAAAEIYEGMLLALDSLKKSNHSVSLFVYDTEADTNKIKKILSDLDIIEPDLIIGPLAPDNIKIVSLYSFERKIPFVLPLAPDESDLKTNPFLFKVIPTDLILYEQYIKYLSTLNERNFILISKNNLKQNEEVTLFKNMLLHQLNQKPGLNSVSIEEVFIDDLLQTNLSEILLPDTLNNVIVFSSYEPDVINALAHLHFLLRDYPIRVFGFPAWQKFDNIRIDVVHELQVTLYSPFFIDYTENSVMAFVQKCREELHSEPFKTTGKGNGINYTYLGYDLAMYYIQAINKYEDNMCDCIEYYNNPLLLSDYNFKRINPQEGFINTSTSFVTYSKDYNVTKIRTPREE